MPAAAAFSQADRASLKASFCEVVAAGRPEVVQSMPAEVKLKDSTVRLYQFESCPFCRKVRSCLDYSRIPYEVVEVHPLSKNETKDFAADYPKVPILRVETLSGASFQMRDSKSIVREVLGKNNSGVAPKVPAPAVTASTGKMWPAEEQGKGSIEEQWIHWTDKVLVQCIVLNVYRSLAESAETFDYLLTHPAFPWYAQKSAAWSGTAVMWAVAKSRKKKFGVADERFALYEACAAFAESVQVGGGRFLGGSKPGAVDFNVYGILRSAEATQTERDLFANCPSILAWYKDMNASVGSSQAVNIASIKRGPAVE